MLKDKRKKSRHFDSEESPNPMEGLGNLADVMLVFACGLLLALVLNLNVDISRISEARIEYKDDNQTKNVEEIDGQGMEEIGKVYKDPKTGKTYIVNE